MNFLVLIWDKFLFEITAKIPDDVTLTLHQTEFPEKPMVIPILEFHTRTPIRMKIGEIPGY